MTDGKTQDTAQPQNAGVIPATAEEFVEWIDSRLIDLICYRYESDSDADKTLYDIAIDTLCAMRAHPFVTSSVGRKATPEGETQRPPG